MVTIALLASITGLVWSCVLAIAATPVLAVLVVWAIACLYGPGTITWDVAGKTLSPDRIALGWLLLVVVVRSLLTGETVRPLRDRALLCFGAFALLCTVQVWLHEWAPVPWDEMPPGIRLLYLVGLPAIGYVAVSSCRSLSPRVVRGLLAAFWLFGVYLALTAVLEMFGPRALVFPRHILRPRELYPGRPVGPFLSTPLLGTLLVTAMAATVLYTRLSKGVLRLAGLVSLPLFVAGIALTQTRSVWLGAVGVTWILLFALSHRLLRYGLVLVGGVALFLAALVAGKQLVNPDRVEGAELVEYSFLQRLALMDGALTLFVQRPLWGWGFGQFERAVNEHVRGGLFGFWATGAAAGLSSHNLALRILAETGLLGFGLFACGWGVWVGRAFFLSRSSDPHRQALSVLALSCYIAYWAEGMFHDPSYQLAGTLTAAILSGAARVLAQTPDPELTADTVCANRRIAAHGLPAATRLAHASP